MIDDRGNELLVVEAASPEAMLVPNMIRKRPSIEGFKRFEDVEFVLPGHIVVAGPNNTGKTTLLQAIAAGAWRSTGGRS